jgi:hypothetical protein
MYAPNVSGSNYIKKNNLLVSKAQIELNTIMVEDFYTTLSPIDW